MMKKGHILKYILLVALLVASLAASLVLGSVNINTGGVDGAVAHDILYGIRLPRALMAILAGGALSLAGYSLQTFFRNPIAGPFILGISSGSKLLVALVMVAGGGVAIGGAWGMIAAAFLGALLATGFVMLCARRVHNMALLLVCGVMIGYICSAITDFVVTFAQDADIVNLHNWSRGSLSGMTMTSTTIASLVILPAGLALFLMSKPMAAYMMGEDYARSLGVNTRAFRLLLVLISSLLAAVVTAFVGPVSFVGIAVPHLVRGFMKDSRPVVIIPACFLLGGVFTLVCDLIARLAFAPTELSISTVTAVFGAPIVIYLLLKNRMGK